MEVVVGVYSEVCVVADEASAELVARVDRLGGDCLGDAGRQVCDDVVESRVVDVIVER